MGHPMMGHPMMGHPMISDTHNDGTPNDGTPNDDSGHPVMMGRGNQRKKNPRCLLYVYSKRRITIFIMCDDRTKISAAGEEHCFVASTRDLLRVCGSLDFEGTHLPQSG